MELNDGNKAQRQGIDETKMDSQPLTEVDPATADGSLDLEVDTLALREFFERQWHDIAFGD